MSRLIYFRQKDVPCSGKFSNTIFRAFCTLSSLLISKGTTNILSSPHPFSFSAPSPSDFKHPANTVNPLLCNCFARSWPIPLKMNKCSQIIRIYHECEGGLEKSVPKIAVSHYEACRVMTNSDPDGRIFLAHRIRISNILSMDRKSILQLFAYWVIFHAFYRLLISSFFLCFFFLFFFFFLFVCFENQFLRKLLSGNAIRVSTSLDQHFVNEKKQ